jgi:hypothetical protein
MSYNVYLFCVGGAKGHQDNDYEGKDAVLICIIWTNSYTKKTQYVRFHTIPDMFRRRLGDGAVYTETCRELCETWYIVFS